MDLLTFITNNWQSLVIGLIFWLLVSISNKNNKNAPREQFTTWLLKPIIIRDRDGSNNFNSAGLSKQDLENITKAVSKVIENKVTPISQKIQTWSGDVFRAITNTSSGEKPLKPFGYLMLLIVFCIFAWADAIGIVNTLSVLGLMDGVQIPNWLTGYEYSVAFGSFFTIIIAGIIANELFGHGEFTDWPDQGDTWKIVAKWITSITIIFGLGVIVALGLVRFYIANSTLDQMSPFLKDFVDIFIYLVVLINGVLCAFLVHREAWKGIILICIGAIQIVFFIFGLFVFSLDILVALGAIGLEIIIKIPLAFLYLIIVILYTPLDALANLISKPFNRQDTPPLS